MIHLQPIRVLALYLILLVQLVSVSSPSSAADEIPAVVYQQSTFPNPYMEIFRIQNSPTDPTPFVLYPTSDKTVWIVTLRFGTPSFSQIINFTLGAPPKVVLTLDNTFLNNVVVDRQGRVWFTKNNTLAFYNPATGIPQDATTYPGDNPQYMAIDGQDRVWLTLINSNQIATYDPRSREEAKFSVPTPKSTLQGITVAPDGTIWFAEAGSKKLGRLDPSTCSGSVCQIEEYAPPPETKLVAPVQVAVDNGGVAWFTDHGTNEFGSFNPQTGEWRKFPVGHCPGSCSIGLPNAIALDARGKIWFSEHFGGRIARYDPESGLLTEYIVPIPPGSSSTTVPLTWWAWPGPNDLVWFAAFGLGQIGYVNASVPVPLTMSADREITVQRGGSRRLAVTINNQGARPASLGISPSTLEFTVGGTALLSGVSNPSEIQPSSGPSISTITISAAWNSTLGSRYVTLTASDGRVATNAIVKVTVVEATAPYAAMAFSLSILLGGLVFYSRRPRKPALKLVKKTRAR